MIRSYTYSLSFPNEAARLAFVPGPGDIDRVAVQLDTKQFWVVKSLTEPVWSRMAAATAPPEWKVLYKSAPVAVPQNPSVYFINEIIDLGPFGLTVNQDDVQIDVVITKPGPNGTRLPTQSNDSTGQPLRGHPAEDLPLVGVEYTSTPLDYAGENLPYVQVDPANLVMPDLPVVGSPGPPYIGVVGAEVGVRGPGNRCRFVRVVAMRSDYVYTPEEWAYIQGYEVHVQVTAPDLIVDQWEFPIPPENDVKFADFLIDLRAYGLSAGQEETTLLMEFRRNGQVIKRSSDRPWTDFPGELFDKPTFPIQPSIAGTIDTGLGEYVWNGNNSQGLADALQHYGQRFNEIATAPYDSGIFVYQAWANCTQDARSLIRVRLFRDADTGPATYIPEPGEPAASVTTVEKENCTVVLKLLRAGYQERGAYPFNNFVAPTMPAAGPLANEFSLHNPWELKRYLQWLQSQIVATYYEDIGFFYRGVISAIDVMLHKYTATRAMSLLEADAANWLRGIIETPDPALTFVIHVKKNGSLPADPDVFQIHFMPNTTTPIYYSTAMGDLTLAPGDFLTFFSTHGGVVGASNISISLRTSLT
jgi:hypothetical protein